MPADPEVALKAAFESANWWSEASVILVVIGVFVEFLALFIWAKDMPKFEKIVMVGATLAVAAGCGGEWLFGGRATSDARQLTDIVDTKAATAIGAAAKIGVAFDTLQAYVKTRQDALQSAEKALDAAVKAANEKLAPRQLTPDQQKNIAEKVAKWEAASHKGKPAIAVFSLSPSFESSALADEIANALTGAVSGEVNRDLVTMGMPFSLKGVGILTSSSARSAGLGAALVQALKDEGIQAFIIPKHFKSCAELGLPAQEDDNPACGQISVEVGDHP